MENGPLISIITPVYNVELYLPQCIESVISQTFLGWELILIDDGSTDNSGSICDKYALMDKRIRVIHKENTGQADSRNIALASAKADIIGFVDSDDWIEPQMYEILYQSLFENKSDIAICGYFLDYIDSSEPSCTEGDAVIYDRDTSLNLIIEDKQIKSFPWDKLFRKDVLTVAFPKSLYYEDYATLFKWFANSRKNVFIRIPLYHYRQRKSSTSNDGDPCKNYHFFLAELERYNYSLTNPILASKKIKFAEKLIKVGIRQAKNIAKYSTDSSIGLNYLLKIADIFLTLDPKQIELLSLNERIKVWKIRHIPIYWFYEIRCRNRLKFWKKNKTRNYY